MNYRPHHSKAFGNRSYDQPNPWLSQEEIFNMRQAPQFHPAMQNMPPSMHSPYSSQNIQNSPANKNFINQNLCNMSNMNFTCTPNPEIFKPHSVNDLGFTNRLIGNRFSGGSYSPANMQHKMNDDLLFKDLPPPNTSHQFSKNDGFSDSSSKLFSNIRSPIEQFSCMQKDQSQFNRKYDDAQIFQGKDFPFSNKVMQSQLPVSFIDKVPASVGSNFSPCKPNYKAPGLFPAYTPKDSNEIPFQKSQTVPDEISKNYCDKSSVSSGYSKAPEQFSGKTESFQERDISLNEVFSLQSNSQSSLQEKSPFKSMSNSPVPQDSLKALESSSSISNSKFPFTSGNNDACFQSSNEIPFQTSQSMQVMNHSNSSASGDCLMQTDPFSRSGTSLHCISEGTTTISPQFSVQPSSKETFSTFESSSHSSVNQNSLFNVTSCSDVHQSTKDTFSSFNFDSNVSTTDISDFLPGLDAFLKEPCKPEETLNKSEDVISKNDACKSSVPNCAFDDEELAKHSIPFIGDTDVSSNNIQKSIKPTYCDQTTVKDKFDFESEKSAELKLPVNNESNICTPDKTKLQKDTAIDKDLPKTQSALEEAIELLVKCDAIVGLDYIIEYKKNISQQCSIPFRCKLCNSSITRPSIIDHIIGSKHRMRYIKAKNESTYEYLVSLKLDKTEKDAKIAEAAFHMELLYGRGCVAVNVEELQADISTENKNKEIGEQIEEPVFTLDKIPIGFEALSPQHEEMDSSAFPLESDLNPTKQEICHDAEKETSNASVPSEMNEEVTADLKTDSVLKLPCLEDGSSSHYVVDDLQLEKLNAEENTKLHKSKNDENIPQISPASCQVKRSLSPQPSCSSKTLKTEFVEKSETCFDMQVDDQPALIKSEELPSNERKVDLMDILENLSKNVISSNEEALMVLKIIGMLVQMLLRYDLPNMSVEKLENMLSSLQVSSSEKNVIEDLKSLLNGTEFQNEMKEESEQKMEPSLQNASGETIEQKLSTITKNRSSEMNATPNEPNVSISSINVLGNNMLSTNIPMTVSEKGKDAAVEIAMSVALNKTGVSKATSDTNVAFMDPSGNSQTVSAAGLKPPPFPDLSTSSTATCTVNAQVSNIAGLKPPNAQVSNIAGLKPPSIPELNASAIVTSVANANVTAAGLKPPPFFSWNQNNETNPVSYANVQGTQNMMWNNAYPFSQQYPQMSYYQPQSYGNHFGGNQSYQSQFPIMSQPPAPPLPPPPISNPPLPPSVPLPANLRGSVSFNPPPPPPLP